MHAEAIATALACGRPGCRCGRKTGDWWTTHCPGSAHDDEDPSFGVRNGRRGTPVVKCRAVCSKDAVVSALKERGLWPKPFQNSRGGRPVVQYEIRDAGGTLVAIHERRDGSHGDKKFIWRRSDGKAGLNGLPTNRLPLYRSETLAELVGGSSVVVVEGEKAADALVGRGVSAVGTVTGAAGSPCSASLALLLPFSLLLWPDSDDAGRDHMERLAQSLSALGHRDVRIVEWEECAIRGGDAADFGGDEAALDALLAASRIYHPTETVDVGELLDELRAFVRAYVMLDDRQLDAIALWIVHTHAFEAAEATPYLHVTSPEKRSGKTRTLEVLSLLVARPWYTGRVTAAVLVRKVARDAPTLLLDESDAAFKGEKEYAEALRGVLNAGHRRGGVASLCVKMGGDFELRDFPVFCPKAIAGLGGLPDTVADRAIPIVLKRRAPGERVDRFRWREAEERAAPIRRRLESWALANTQSVADARPDIPNEIDDRAADGWEPLLAVAADAAGSWPEQALAAAVALSTGESRSDESLGVRLLADIREIFAQRGVDRIPSWDLAKALAEIEESPWGDIRGKALDARALARRLKPHDIRPRTVRFGKGNAETAKGYEAAMFADSWQRYLPFAYSKQPSQPSQPSQLLGSTTTHVTDVTAVTGNTEIPLDTGNGLIPMRRGFSPSALPQLDLLIDKQATTGDGPAYSAQEGHDGAH